MNKLIKTTECHYRYNINNQYDSQTGVAGVVKLLETGLGQATQHHTLELHLAPV